MSGCPVKAKSTGESRVGEANEDLHSFLVRELPPGKTKQASYLMEVLREAGARFDRYDAKRNEWLNYATRRSRLETITNLLEELESCLCDLDILSRDELANRVDPKMIETFVGSIRLLRKETTNLAKLTRRDADPLLEKVEAVVRGVEAVSTVALLDLLGLPKTTGNGRRVAQSMRSLGFIPIKSRRLMPGGYRDTVTRGWARPLRKLRTSNPHHHQSNDYGRSTRGLP